jgi:hypothetical protein
MGHEVSLGRKPLALSELALLDHLLQVIGDLLVELPPSATARIVAHL